jgi:hypothetical protein
MQTSNKLCNRFSLLACDNINFYQNRACGQLVYLAKRPTTSSFGLFFILFALFSGCDVL